MSRDVVYPAAVRRPDPSACAARDGLQEAAPRPPPLPYGACLLAHEEDPDLMVDSPKSSRATWWPRTRHSALLRSATPR